LTKLLLKKELKEVDIAVEYVDSSMSEFFNSDIVSGELQEITELQQFCFKSVQTFRALSPDKRLDYFFKLKKLIEKQHIFWVRLKLSDDPQAQAMMQNLRLDIIRPANPGKHNDTELRVNPTTNDNLEPMFKELLTKVDIMIERASKEVEGGLT